MKRAIELAQNGRGFVAPNPMVGAVIIKEGNIVGEGWHKKFGSVHAELNAITNSKLSDFSECTMFVNLEPCSHYGKTPPCVDKLIELNFKRIVIGTLDKNPKVAGTGYEKLKNANIDVTLGVLEDDCNWLNRVFFKNVTENLPYIMLKIAQTIDGYIATKSKNSKWITSETSRNYVHLLRSEFDAVLVGNGTINHDNPELTVRNVEGRNPKRIVLDQDLTISLSSNIITDQDRKNTYIICNLNQEFSKKANNLTLAGVKIFPSSVDDKNKFDLKEIVLKIYEGMGVNSILVEGGAEVFYSFIRSGLVDEIQIFIAPKILGGGLKPFDGFNFTSIKDALNYEIVKTERFDNDILVILKKPDVKK